MRLGIRLVLIMSSSVDSEREIFENKATWRSLWYSIVSSTKLALTKAVPV